jgi:hypothetical protein
VRRVGVVAGLVVLGVLVPCTRARAQVAAPAPETLAVGDWQLAPVVETRLRGEYRHDLDDRDRGLLTERVRLGVDVERGPVEGRVVLQDARLWDLGAGSDTLGQQPQFALTGPYEAWGGAHTASAHPSFVRVGRQAVTWGEGRLLGVSDWSPAGRTLDAVRGRLVVGDGAFELLAAVLSETVPPRGEVIGEAYGELFGARGEWAFDPLFALDAYALARIAHDDPTTAILASEPSPTVRGQTYTGALRLHGDAHAWTWGAEGAYQLGHSDDLRIDRSAWAAAGHVAYTFDHVLLLPTVRLGASYASGDDGGSTYRAFDPLLPDVHTWHGAMDLFSWSNEEEASFRAAIAPWTDGIAAVEYRYARLAQPGGAWRSAYLQTIGVAPGNTSADLGHEIDAILTWSPWVPVELTAGYSVALLGDGAKAILASLPGSAVSPSGLSHFAYGQATLRVP